MEDWSDDEDSESSHDQLRTYFQMSHRNCSMKTRNHEEPISVVDLCTKQKIEASRQQDIDYIKEYSEISATEQLLYYNTMFHINCKEYRDLHTRICSFRRKYKILQDKLSQCNPGTSDYFTSIERIYNQYKSENNNPSYKQQEERLSYLHGKLQHLLNLMRQYEFPILCSLGEINI